MATQENIAALTKQVKDIKTFMQDSKDSFTTDERKQKVSILLDAELILKQGELLRLKEQLEADEEKYNPNRKPACGKKYWTINSCGVVIFCFWGISDTEDNWRLTNQIVFKTEEQCKEGKRAIELKAEILRNNTRYEKTYVMLVVSSISNDSQYLTDAMNSTCIDEVFGDRIKALKEYM